MKVDGPIVCVVTDRRRVSPDARTPGQQLRDFEAWLDEVLRAGAGLVQLREPDLDAAILSAIARGLAARAAGTGTRVLVNDRADVARAAGADGVHLRGDGPAAGRVRALGPTAWIVGRSVHSAAESAAGQDADYLIFGAVFPTVSKPGRAPAGLDALHEVARMSGVSVLAIGGIDERRARAVVAAGADGVAAIGLFLPEGREPSALGPARAVAALRAAMLE